MKICNSPFLLALALIVFSPLVVALASCTDEVAVEIYQDFQALLQRISAKYGKKSESLRLM